MNAQDPLSAALPKSKAQLNREKYAAQALARATPSPKPIRRRRESRPIVGSQEWAETRGDDLGASPDY